MSKASGYYLLVDVNFEAVSSKILLSGVESINKSLRSGEKNWLNISELAEDEACRGVIVLLRMRAFYTIAERPLNLRSYRSVFNPEIRNTTVEQLFTAIGAKPHLVLAHEALVAGATMYESPEITTIDSCADEEDLGTFIIPEFDVIEEEARLTALKRLDEWDVTITPYKRNAEASLLAAGFFEDQHSNLLFRIYLPVGQIYEKETAQLLNIFHEWLASVRDVNVRQSGYTTQNGRVVEFFAASPDEVQIVHDEVPRFKQFFSSLGSVDEAERLLKEYGVESGAARELVSSFSGKFRRLRFDVKKEWETRILQIRHELESALLDEAPLFQSSEFEDLIVQMFPSGPSILGLPFTSTEGSGRNIHLHQTNYNQVVERAEGIIAQNIAGGVRLSPEAIELEKLIAVHAASDRVEELLHALRELDDELAPQQERLKAGGKIRRFLYSAGEKIGQVGFGIAQSYLESKLGI